MTNRFVKLILLALLALGSTLMVAKADETSLSAAIDSFAKAQKFSDTAKAVEELANSGDERAVQILRALGDGNLKILAAEDTSGVADVVIVEGKGASKSIKSALTGEVINNDKGRKLKKIRIKNSLRRQISFAIAKLTLSAKNPQTRLDAANALFKKPEDDSLEPLKQAIASESDSTVKTAMQQALAAIELDKGATGQQALQAIAILKARGDQDALTMLTSFADKTDSLPMQNAAQKAVESIESSLAAWQVAQNVWYGLSLGSVLLLASIGLAITFGVMGVINMAHGEMVMLGAYSTYGVQKIMATYWPQLFEYNLLISLPVAFVVAGSVGFAIERGIIRFLYGRPLETLLATFGVSLILQQAVRTIFGPTNKEVVNPDFMSGSFKLGELLITWNRLWILVFSIVVFLALLAVLKKTRFGLQMRAVTQNRAMAASMGIKTPWVDAFTFAFGSGIAGLAGVALSQIDNVSPNLGQGYLIDSFMVVVFGGVGNLWGTLVGAVTLGITNKFLEPYSGAVLAKIIILVAIILFIQKRPRGLFALKGRSVEA